MKYRPLIPSGKIVHARCAAERSALVVFWLWWALTIQF
jgi:hypothetical protein